MGRFALRSLGLAVAIAALGSVMGCASKPKSTPLYPEKINLAPTNPTSLALGGTLTFTATAQTTGGTTLNVPITYSSSDTSVLNFTANGVACAGLWDVAFTTCTPGNTGVVQVTASTLGVHSVPTYVFVHPPIDSITVNGILLDGVPVQEPCLSQSQSMTLEAHAFRNGTDITASVGPFTWSANNVSVVTLTPLVNLAYDFPTNQVTATAVTPGITRIYASASGVSSNTFQQPQYNQTPGDPSSPLSPSLDFFATCPINSISLDLDTPASGQTSFSVGKGTGETVVATMTDVMGNSTLPNTNGGIVLSKIPLTWVASQSGVLAAGSSCTNTCALTTPSPGAGSVMASCSPPTCNVGFPVVPTSLSTTAQVNACTNFFQAKAPAGFSCSQLIPAPVYAPTAVSGIITGTPNPATIIAGSTGCLDQPPSTCSASIYQFVKGAAGTHVPLPAAPNSLMFDPSGARVYMGSAFGSAAINPANFGTTNSPFTSFGTVTGTILATSANGTIPLFADTLHSPNQVYVIPTTGTPIALNIAAPTAAAFSPDGLKTYIVGNSGTSLYLYSPLQALQGPISLAGKGSAIGFSTNGAFAFIAEKTGGAGPNLTAFANCANSAIGSIAPVATVALPADPILMKVLPNAHMDGRDSYGNLIPDGVHILVLDATGFDIITANISGFTCPQTLAFVSDDPVRQVQRIELGQGPLQPLNFFASADASELYIVSSNSSTILTYNFISGAVVGGIELLGNALPLSADISPDTTTIAIAGNDGMVHEVSTLLGGGDLVQISFPDLPNYLNPFCTFTPNAGPCTLTTVLVKP